MDADADAARQLARAIAMNRVSSVVDWNETLARLGDKEAIESLDAGIGAAAGASVEMDSTKRKRRKKMTKHRYKKRRRAQRAERRKLGK